MANGSGDNRGQDPWGRRPDKGPPDLISLVKNFFEKTAHKASSGGGSSSGIEAKYTSIFIIIGVIIVLIIWALSGVFILKPAEQAVITRFGKYVSTVGPGPHWIPPFIESHYTLNVQQVSNFPYQAEMLTKDENIVSVAVAVQYRIANARDYLFNVVNPVSTLQQATSSALRQEVGQVTLNSILTTGRQELRLKITEQLEKILVSYKSGLKVADVTLQSTKPPAAVMKAFNDAVKAREDSQRYQNKAQAYARKKILSAKGRIAQIVQAAKAYKESVVLHAKGAIARYLALLKPYQQAPVVTRERLYIDAVSSVLSHTTNVIVDTKGSNMLLLPLQQLLKGELDAKKSTVAQDSALPDSGVTDNAMNVSTAYGTDRPTYPIEGS